MKRTKLFAFIIAIIAVFTLALTGCNNGNKPSEDNNGTYYIVSFDSMGGSSVESQRVLQGNPARSPKTPTRATYSFIGWYKSSEYNAEEWKFATDRVTSNITLYAKWQSDEIQTETASLNYERNENGYTVTGASGQEERIIIPTEYNGSPVTEIGENAFAYSRHTSGITYVSIPDTVTKIGLNAFYNRSELITIDIGGSSNLMSIGRNAFSGNRALKSIYIPQGVSEIGDSAFNNCGSLDSISVSVNNTVYSGEGNNLIEIATHTLMRGSNHSVIPTSVTAIAQAAFRRANGITALSIPVSVTEIGNYFISDSTITTIRYAGTEGQWNAVIKTTMWNYGNRDVTIVYSVTDNDSRVLVAYFSRTGENYNVGVIQKGNTEIIAEMIAEEANADLFEIEPVVPYPSDYREMLQVARQEASTDARPAIKDVIDGFDNYDIVFIGYPIWNGTCPNIMLTFMESYNFSGKTVIPFSTHAGSGLGSSVSVIRNKLTGADILSGLAVAGTTAQNDRNTARNQVHNFIQNLNIDFTSNASENDERILREVYNRRLRAMVEQDTATLASLMDDDLILRHITGATQTKQEWLADIAAGNMFYIHIDNTRLEISINGNRAALTHTNIIEARINGGHGTWTLNGTSYYEKRGDTWIWTNAPTE